MDINSVKLRKALIQVLSGGGEGVESSDSAPPPDPKKKKKLIVMVVIGAGALMLITILIALTIQHFSSGNKTETKRNNDTTNTETSEIRNEERGPPLCGSQRGLVASSLRGTSSWPVGDHDNISEGCSRLDWNTTTAKTACINSFEESTEGTFHNCKWNVDTCTAETDECEPLQAGRSAETLKPFCTSGVWQPWHNLGGSEEMESSQYCWCREGEVGANIKTNNKAVSRCLPSSEHTSNFPEIFNSGQIRDSF